TTPAVPGSTGAEGQTPLTSSKSATINYEVDKTIQHTRKALGQIRRLSVAVAVNHKEEKDKNGAVKSVPISDEEKKRIEDLVREAVGYNKERGDTINVATGAFVASDKDSLELPIWKDPDNIVLFKELIKYLVIAGVIAFVAFGVIRPLMKQVMPPPPETKEDEEAQAGGLTGEEGEEGEEGEDEDGAAVALSPEAAARLAYDEKIAKVHEIAKSNPRVVANLIKEWMGTNEQQR
ncbi:flagellar M-ring protein FliF C-terminal domain-containing protein, partial [Zoogloea sp.]|uniref:flagellar M-ring protein FliF C-terminal domain-containing protein n=1 Tax=Zoogloea sp. TaxID=49181 RepID=UPI0014169CE0